MMSSLPSTRAMKTETSSVWQEVLSTATQVETVADYKTAVFFGTGADANCHLMFGRKRGFGQSATSREDK